eukprot:TRINITY_DN2837_c0_g1_i1.p1 TRINITY_DN2837_c0_g1~~TRINITY_DN2837_c0_g1_i1.p1  ORF type:complete len:186 (-),score=16.56 TRINITY_DN2837_c0_g1_i1:58-615(-)
MDQNQAGGKKSSASARLPGSDPVRILGRSVGSTPAIHWSTSTQEVIFVTGDTVILQTPATGTQRTLPPSYTNPLQPSQLCFAVARHAPYLVVGQGGAFGGVTLWHIGDGTTAPRMQVKFISGHEQQGVAAVAISGDGRFVSSVDQSGMNLHWWDSRLPGRPLALYYTTLKNHTLVHHQFERADVD